MHEDPTVFPALASPHAIPLSGDTFDSGLTVAFPGLEKPAQTLSVKQACKVQPAVSGEGASMLFIYIIYIYLSHFYPEFAV